MLENVLRALSWALEVTIRSYEVFRSRGWELELVIVEGGCAATPGRLGGWIVKGPLEYGASLREVWDGRLSGALEVDREMEADMLPLDMDLVGDPELGMLRPKELGIVILVLAV